MAMCVESPCVELALRLGVGLEVAEWVTPPGRTDGDAVMQATSKRIPQRKKLPSAVTLDVQSRAASVSARVQHDLHSAGGKGWLRESNPKARACKRAIFSTNRSRSIDADD